MITIKKTNIVLIVLVLISSMILGYIVFLDGSKYEINSMENEVLFERLINVSQIGEQRANLIIENKPYSSLEDILKIDGVGKQTYIKIKKYFKVREVIR